MKITNLLPDEPSSTDAFGPHNRIPDELVRLISAENPARSPRSVGLLGDWGSGKSSVIRIMKDRLGGLEGGNSRFHIFIYDAWAHQGDELRRAFLDTLVESLGSVLKESDKKKLKNRIWKKEETTETKSVSVLRRHGKILLLSLFLSPIFLRFYQSPPNQWGEAQKCIWNYVSFFGIFLPLIMFAVLFIVRIAPIRFARRWLLGTDDTEEIEKIRISSVFFQRTEGQIDIKTTTNPSDSIREFNNIFRDICELAINLQKKIVFVIDNIDRLDHDDARLFWATMQSFLDRSLWVRPNDVAKVFYIVPFSPLAIKSTFATKHGGSDASQSFVDKTFDLSIYVSPPIQVNVRGYLLGLLKTAFPEHDTAHLETVRDLYDYHRSAEGKLGQVGDAETTRRTPRQMKLFVNQLVALYRIRGDELALEAMAAYLLCQSKINESGLAPDDHLSLEQLHLLPSEPDVVQQLAAVHFGVSLATAAQVVLFEPIRKALREGEPYLLRGLSDRSGFCDVLKLAIGTRDSEASVADALQIALVLGDLPGSNGEEYGQVWNALLNNLRHATKLGTIDNRVAGLRLMFQHLHENRRSSFVSVVCSGVGGSWLSSSNLRPRTPDDTDEAFEKRMLPAEGLARVAQELVEMKVLEKLGPISLRTHAEFATRLIGEVSRCDNGREIAAALELDLNGDVAKSIADWPGVRSGSLTWHDFVRTAGLVKGYNPDWSKVANLAVSKVSSAGSEATQADVALRLLLSIASLHPKLGVEKVIQGLFADGTLAAVMQEAADRDELSAAIVVAFLVSAPGVNSSSLVLANGRPATNLNNLLQNEAASSDILDQATELAISIQRTGSLFFNAAYYTRVQPLAREVLVRLIELDHRIFAAKATLVKGQNFISSLPSEASIVSFYELISSSESVLRDLNKKEIIQGESYTYIRATATTWGGRSIALRNRLRKYADTATSDLWVSAITDDADQSNLMATLAGLKRLGVEAGLGATASDAITTVVERSVSSNGNINSRTANLVAALAADVKSNLSAKIWQLLVASKSFEPLSSALSIMPEVIQDTSSRSLTELLNTVFMRALLSGDARLVRWMRQIIREREPEFLGALPALAEFRSRTSSQLRTSGLSRELRSELKELVTSLPKPSKGRKDRAAHSK